VDRLSDRERLDTWLRPGGVNRGMAALVFMPLALLGVAQLLPSSGLGLAIRLGAAFLLVLIVPGALVQRLIGEPREPGVAIAGALMWSLALVAFGLAVTFAVGRSLTLVLVVIALASVLAAVPALRSPARPFPRAALRPIGVVVVVGLLLGVAVWWVSEAIQGDGLFHTARARKLDELPSLGSVNALNEFRDGGLHPGYAFPVWHAVMALVARLADVDVGLVIQYGPALLVPLALVVTYAAGAVLFDSWAGGLGTVGAQLGLGAFANGGIGSLELLTLPPAAARLLLVPALLALVLAYLKDPQRRLLPAVALGALAVTIVHASYMVFVCMIVLGYAIARLISERREARDDLGRVAAVFVALLVPFAAFLAWLLPVLRETAAVRPDPTEAARAIERYAEALVVSDDTFRLSADTIVRGGATAIAAFLLMPVFIFAMRRRSTALVVGGAFVLLAVALVPALFTQFSEFISLSQARRLPAFLPLAFAVGGGALLLARARHYAVAGALALGVALVLIYPAGAEPGRSTGWALWIGLAGIVAGLLFGRRLGRSLDIGTNGWATLVVAAFLIPVSVDALAGLAKEPADPRALPPSLVEAVRQEVSLGEVVFADLETSYRLAAAAPVPIAAGPPAHVAQTAPNRPFERRQDVIRFFYRAGVDDAQRLELLEQYDATWLVVDRTRGFPEGLISQWPSVPYDDGRYALLRVPRG
jgi:hypothetical protein